jgi:hypothetical protein
MNQITDTASFALLAGGIGFEPIEERLRANVRATIEAVFEEDLASFLGRLRYGRAMAPRKGIATGTGSANSPAPSGPKRCGCRARGSRTTPAR